MSHSCDDRNENSGINLIRRRDFLKNTGAALAAGALGGCSTFGSNAQILARNSGGFDEKGIWWLCQGFFEYTLGPWQPYLPPNPDVVTIWKSAIDWFADNGFTFIVPQIAPWAGEAMPSAVGADKVRFGWGYHYVLNFDKFPEARCTTDNAKLLAPKAVPFEPDDIIRNQDIVRAITDYGKEKGIDVYQHHYNFMATVPFVRAHLDMIHCEFLQRDNWVDLKPPVWDLRQNLCFDVCWNKKIYQEFLVSCFEEYLELFPSAAGILATPGERARCQCVDCIGEQPTAAAAKQNRYSNSPEKRKTISHFCKVFAETVQNAGRKPLVRSWINSVPEAPEQWAAELPKGITYVTKYSVFDIMNSGPDPLIKHFLDAGHDMWFMKEITGGENAGPSVMTVPEHFDEMAKVCRDMGIKGILSVDNGEHGYQFYTTKVQHADRIQFANAFCKDSKISTAEVLRREYIDIFGEAGPAILEANKKVSQVPFNITRFIYSQTEGYTFGFPYYFCGFGGLQKGWPGILGENTAPPEWARREIAAIPDYVDYLKDNPWDNEFRAKITGAGKDPFAEWARIVDTARQGRDELEALATKVPAEAKKEIDLLINSAHVSYQNGKKWLHFFNARLYYAGAMSPTQEHKRRELAQLTVSEYNKALKAMRELIEWMKKLPADIIDHKLTVGRAETDLKKKVNPEETDPAQKAKLEFEILKTELGHLLGPQR